MNEQKKLTEQYEALSKLVRIILQIFFGGLISPIFRILRWTETKNTTTLVVAIVCLVTGIGNAILGIVDLITVITKDKFVYFVD